MTRSTLTAFGAALILPLPSVGRAQRVLGVIYDSTARAPLAGAVISIVDAHGVTTTRTTSDAAGRFSLTRPTAAAEFRAIRIGFRPSNVSLAPGRRDTTIELTLFRLPPLLATVRIADRPLCPTSTDRGSAFQLWDQVRTGLLSSIVARNTNPGEATTVVFRRRVAPNDGAVREESRDLRRGQTTKPFVSAANAATLARGGFMTEDAGARVFYGPDEDVLLDESFGATHCFHLRAPDATHDGQVGLAFDPAPGRDTLVDVTGVIWMDANPLALRSMDFTFTGLEPATMRVRPGGHLEFHQTVKGVALAVEWSLRLPILAAAAGATPNVLQRPATAGRRGRTDVRVTEVEETTAELLDMGWPDETAFHADQTGVLGQALRDGNEGAPFALISIDGSSRSADADGGGGFCA